MLVEASETIDTEVGSQYTVKEYESTKVENEEGWTHSLIRLLPRSTEPAFEPIELSEDNDIGYRVIGEFVRVL